jgi:membrane fusion protein (multidrug efflux system)
MWGVWWWLAQVSVYEISESARIEADRAVAPVQAPLAGRVVVAGLSIGREVRVGDVLVELDTEPEQRQMSEHRARLAALSPRLEALRERMAAEDQARTEEQTAAAEEARAGVKEVEARQASRKKMNTDWGQLHAYGLIAEREYLRSRAEAERSQAAAQIQHFAADRRTGAGHPPQRPSGAAEKPGHRDGAS